MSDCSLCSRPFTRIGRLRCHECGACEDCCLCEDDADTDGYDVDSGRFDRDELGLDPEED